MPEASAVKGSSRTFFPNLDGLRAVAALLVLIAHLFGNADQHIHHNPWLDLVFHRWLTSGGVGVSFFFVLSGFLITYLLLEEMERTGGLDVRAFYIRRVLRIWPLYYLTVLIGFVYPVVKTVLQDPAQLLTERLGLQLLFLSNFDVLRNPFVGAMSQNITWSVAIEEQFYLFWPLLLLALKPRLLPAGLAAVILGSWAFRFANAGDPRVLYFHTLAVISDMAVGGLGAYLCLRSAPFRERIENLPRRTIGLVYLVGLAAIFFAYDSFNGPFLAASRRLVFSCFYVFVILEQNLAVASAFKMGDLKTLTKLGRYSYGIYMLHPIPLTLTLRECLRWGLAPQGWDAIWISGSLTLVLTLAMAWASYHWYERPFLKLKERYAQD